MQITVTGKHLEVTQPIHDYAEKRVAKLARYFDRTRQLEVLIDKADHGKLVVEFIAHVDHSNPLVAKVAGTDLYAAIDDATEKMERQLTDHKEKVRNRKHVG